MSKDFWKPSFQTFKKQLVFQSVVYAFEYPPFSLKITSRVRFIESLADRKLMCSRKCASPGISFGSSQLPACTSKAAEANSASLSEINRTWSSFGNVQNLYYFLSTFGFLISISFEDSYGRTVTLIAAVSPISVRITKQREIERVKIIIKKQQRNSKLLLILSYNLPCPLTFFCFFQLDLFNRDSVSSIIKNY